MGRKLVLAGLFLATLFAAGAAEARKVALVIGNERYEHLEKLQKAAADATGYADVLKAKAFDQVILRQNLTRLQMDEAIAEFIDAISPGDIAVFVYSGHGWSNGNQNFIVGIDAPDTVGEGLLARIAIPVANGINGIVDEMANKGAALKVAIVDACRNNPFKPQSGGKSIGFGRGFNRLKEPPPDGTFLVFSAGAGQVALDRLSETDADPHGVFTRTFLPLLGANMTLLDATKAAQERVFEVARAIGHDQLPAYYDEVKGKACLSESCDTVTAPVVIAPPPVVDRENEFWAYIRDSRNPDYFAEYLRLFPAGTFAAVARSRLDDLERERQKRAASTDLAERFDTPKVVTLGRAIQLWDKPAADAGELRTVAAGRQVVVIGTVGSGDWYRVIEQLGIYQTPTREFVPRSVIDGMTGTSLVASIDPTAAYSSLQRAVAMFSDDSGKLSSDLASIRHAAVAKKGNAFYFVWSRSTEDEASRDALSNCGGSGCSVVATLQFKQCYALYWAGKNGWGWAVRNDIDTAVDAARSSCSSSNKGCYKSRTFCADGTNVYAR